MNRTVVAAAALVVAAVVTAALIPWHLLIPGMALLMLGVGGGYFGRPMVDARFGLTSAPPEPVATVEADRAVESGWIDPSNPWTSR